MLGDRLKKARKEKQLTQSILAKMLKTSVSYISEIESNKKSPGSETLVSLKNNLKVNIDWLLTGRGQMYDYSAKEDECEFELIPEYSVPVCAGNGNYIYDSDIKSYHCFSSEFIRNELLAMPTNLFVFRISGDSMEPTFFHKDFIIVDKSIRVLNDSRLYVFSIDNELLVKRVQTITNDKYLLISDNKTLYEPREYYLSELKIIGRVIWFGRKLI